MEPEKKPSNTEPGANEAYNIRNTVNNLHDEGVDIVDDDRLSDTTPAQAPIPEAPKPDVTPPIPPDLEKTKAQSDINALLGNTPSPKPAVTPEPTKEAGIRNDPSIKPLRTFKSDAEEAVRYQNISTTQIAVAEQKKREVSSTPIEYENGKKSSPALFIALLVMFALILGGGYYYFAFMRSDTPSAKIPEGLKVTALVPYDKADILEIDREDDPVISIAGALAAAPIRLGEVFTLVPVPFGTTTSMASISSVLSETNIPGMLERSLANEYMIGTYLYEANNPFIILKTTFFQNAYAGMLEWEKDMRNDLMSLIRIAHPEETPINLRTDTFTDSVVSNIDVRLLRGSTGEIILAYGFADKDTIVISTDLETIKFLLDKLLAVRVVQ